MRPFQGMVFDQSGKKTIAAGKVMNGKELKGINFHGKGAEGTKFK